VVDVRVRQQHRVDGMWVERRAAPVQQSELLQALEKPGVDLNGAFSRT
jgi:hypothetical protein